MKKSFSFGSSHCLQIMSQEVGFSVDSGALEASLLNVSGTNY